MDYLLDINANQLLYSLTRQVFLNKHKSRVLGWNPPGGRHNAKNTQKSVKLCKKVLTKSVIHSRIKSSYENVLVKQLGE